MSGIKAGNYKNKKTKDVVRAIYYPSFEDEVVSKNYSGIYKCWNIQEFLKTHTRTTEPIRSKVERVKDER